MIIADCDDQGRFLAIPDSVKWTFCPNVEAIEIDEIGNLLGELAADRMIVVYGEAGQYGQIVNWWDYQKPRWARPSLYPPPDGWIDRVNIRQGDSVLQENWNEKGGFSDSNSGSGSDNGSDSDNTCPPTVGGHSTADDLSPPEGASDVAAVDDDSLDLYFDQLGIEKGKKREQLAALPHVTPELLREWRRWKNSGKRRLGVGWIITRIEAGEWP